MRKSKISLNTTFSSFCSANLRLPVWKRGQKILGRGLEPGLGSGQIRIRIDKPASNSIDQLHIPVEPKPFELGEDVEGGELLEVEDLNVGHPDLLHQGDVHRDQSFVLVSKLKDF